MRPSIEMAGQQFGRLGVVERAGSMNGEAAWACRCDCGNLRRIKGSALRTGSIVSCGCYRIERRFKHGGKGTPEYRAWRAMKSRCDNPKLACWENYGGRGIRVCDRWLNSFETFLADVGPRPSPLHSIDRWPDNDGNYEPSNVRWATNKQQCQNRRKPRVRRGKA